MNYTKIYNEICERGQLRNKVKNNGNERHHIIPRCCKGTNDASNITIITAREHFLCHWLLTKMYPKNRKLLHALSMMSMDKDKRKLTSRQYEICRMANMQASAGIKKSKEHNKKVSLALTGENHPMFGKRGALNPNFGSRRTEAAKINMRKPRSEAAKINMRKPRSEEGKKNISKGVKLRYKNAIPKKWYYNPLTLDRIYINKNEIPPSGYVSGMGKVSKKTI